MSLDILLGITQRNTARRLLWDMSNGMLLAGVSGSGKSQSACFYASQYAAKGVKIILAEFAAYSKKGEGLVDRCKHIEPAYYLPPARDADTIIDYIYKFNKIAETRLNPITGDTVDHFPIVFFIDEFSALMLQYQKEIPIELLRSMSMTIRKVDMKLVLMGQSWSMLGQQAPQLREMFDHVIVHRLMQRNARLFAISNDEVQQIMRLEAGWALKDSDLMYVPSKISGENLEAYKQRIKEMHPQRSIDELLESLLFTSTSMHTNIKAESVADLVEVEEEDNEDDKLRELMSRGINKSQIIWEMAHVAGGSKYMYYSRRIDELRKNDSNNTE